MIMHDFNDPAVQEDCRQNDEDKFIENFHRCSCCDHIVYPGDRYSKCRKIIICHDCMIELEENERIFDL